MIKPERFLSFINLSSAFSRLHSAGGFSPTLLGLLHWPKSELCCFSGLHNEDTSTDSESDSGWHHGFPWVPALLLTSGHHVSLLLVARGWEDSAWVRRPFLLTEGHVKTSEDGDCQNNGLLGLLHLCRAALLTRCTCVTLFADRCLLPNIKALNFN